LDRYEIAENDAKRAVVSGLIAVPGTEDLHEIMDPGSENTFESPLPIDLLEVYPDACILLNKEQKILGINTRGTALLGSPAEQILDRKFSDFLEPSFRDKFAAFLMECGTRGKISTAETRIFISPHESRDVTLFISPYSSPGKQATGRRLCFLFLRDISVIKAQELDLLRFANVAHYTVNPLEITDRNGKIIYVNPAFEKASGYSKEEIIGKNPNVFGSGKKPAIFWNNMWETVNAGRVWVGEIENRRKNGDPFHTQLLISPILDASGSVVGYFGVHRDISEQKYLEQHLVHAQKMESIGLLAAGIAHEVGNPLTSISSLVQIIQRATSEEFTREKLELIKSQVTRITRTIRDLVNFSRRSSYEVELLNINKPLVEAVEMVRVGRKAKGIAFRVDLDPELPIIRLVGDQVEQVFINILINAVDAIIGSPSVPQEIPRTQPGEITVRSFLDDEQIVVTIHDNGSGITEQSLPKIFEPFFTTKPVGEGTGLGLWVSYGIIKSFQGTITVDSPPGKGTTFTIALPTHSNI
jgi:PAS domain S-box-containing protein